VSGCIDHLYTQLRATSNYSAISDLHTFTKPQSVIVFCCHCLVTTLNNGDSSASLLTPLPTD
jgi:hypothetical protein